ncbi:MAG: hypothetical protein KDF65_12090 [Anaerolineae bacterium]|nr:hypothetical protein [Anaerolineae bacterium]
MTKKLLGFIILILILTGLDRPGAVQAQVPSPAHQSRALTAPLPLSAYPRPKNDNGMGIHWSTHLYGQDDEVTDYFVAEIKAMNIKWVKYLNDQTEGRHYDYLVEQLVANDIMPIARIYIGCNDPLDLGSLGRMVEHYLPKGLYYYELYNEPDIWGPDGGWCDDPEPDPEKLARVWAPAAREVIARGGYPSLPSIFPIGKNIPEWENSFFQRFLQAIKANGDTDILYGSWGAVHNYFINHPPGYPLDEVNQTGKLLTAADIARYQLDEAQVQAINRARTLQYEPDGYHVGTDPTQDVTGFLQFIGYHDQFTELFGFEIPLISTEGGATVGSCEDPRYPCVNAQMQMEWTLAAYEYMLDEAPEYYFANNTWLIAQRALDFWGGTVWESNSWYHDRKGDHLPIVEALKSHPRKGEARWDQGGAGAQGRGEAGVVAPHCVSTSPTGCPTAGFASLSTETETIATLSQISNLARYPRPGNDNGRGAHYAPTILAQPPQMVDFFIDELQAMNIKWLKIMQGDLPKVEHQYLVEQLVAHDIEPIIRVYRPYNDPYENLAGLVAAAQPLGVHYYELYNEPNIGGFPGGWRDGEAISVARMLDLWIPAAEAIQQAGGYPGLPTLAPGGSYDDMVFLREFLDGLIARQRTDLLDRAWIPLHNYFLNHPFDYPSDPVNLHSVPLSAEEISRRGLTPEQVQIINTARANSHQPGGYYVGDTVHEDSNGFRKFEAYAQIFYDRFGYHIPIITTEGGPLTGDHQDPRYPAITDADVTDLTVRAYHAMLDTAPAYYFAFAPWLLANGAGGHWDAAWEGAAWYKVDGSTLPVVAALKGDPRRNEVRNWDYRPLNEPAPATTQLQATTNPAVPPANPAAAAPPPQNAGAGAAVQDQNALSAEIISVSGRGPAWSVTQANWQTAASPYPRLRINVLDQNGRQLGGQQVRVQGSGSSSILLTEASGAHNASVPLTAPGGVYVVSIAGGSGQAVRAKGADGHDLTITFQQAASE